MSDINDWLPVDPPDPARTPEAFYGVDRSAKALRFDRPPEPWTWRDFWYDCRVWLARRLLRVPVE